MTAPFGPVTVVVIVPSAFKTTLVVSAELLEFRLLRSVAAPEDDAAALLEALDLLPVACRNDRADVAAAMALMV